MGESEAALGPAGEPLADFLLELLKKHSRLGVTSIAPDARITQDAGLDSFALLELTLELEERLGVTIPEDQMPDLVSLSFAEFVAFVANLTAAKRTAGAA